MTTKPPARPNPTLRAAGSVVAASLALPGVWQPARADSAPDDGLIALRYLHYRDSQPGLERIRVDSPSLYLLAPLSPQWSLEATGVLDQVSGATPRWHTAISSASRMREERKAGEVKLTRYFARSSLTVGLAHSTEHDYDSTAGSLVGSWSTDDRNTTLHAGLGYAGDRIDPVNAVVINESRKTADAMIGITQAWTRSDVVQLNLTYASGRGYYDDPYKRLDRRPRERQQAALLGRWNHHFAGGGSTLRASWRWYRDSYKVDAHTLQAEWVVPVTTALTLTPLARVYSQGAASFYVDPVYDGVLGAPFPPGYDPLAPPALISQDQRLSAFGALTLGLKAAWQLTPLWSVDGKIEAYEQRGAWRLGGSGSPGLDPLRAVFVQFGASRKF